MADWLQRGLALLLALLTAPLLLVLAVLVRWDSAGSPFYVAPRVGEGGRTFGLVKLRTMSDRARLEGPGITAGDDVRITRVGMVLRRSRLDELPQLWNVVAGQMRLVGPRPEDPRFVEPADPLHSVVFRATPGITGAAQLLHTEEAALLDPSAIEQSYRTAVLPAKVRIDAAYLSRRSARLDLWILAQTALALAGRPPRVAEVARRLRLDLSDLDDHAARKRS